MAYIYCITNLINNKRYVGKTTLTIELRFKEHCKDSLRLRCSKRPLYDAMNKYGIENFKIELLEEVKNPKMLAEKEIYWIQELRTFGSFGYNATKGGDGKILYDYNEIIELALLGYKTSQIKEKLGCSFDTIRKVLKAHNIKPRVCNAKYVALYDLAGNFILIFPSACDALLWLFEKGLSKNKLDGSKINACCNHKITKYCKYKWEYLPDPN